MRSDLFHIKDKIKNCSLGLSYPRGFKPLQFFLILTKILDL